MILYHTVACVKSEPPSFSSYSQGKALTGGLFGVVGGVIAESSMNSDGNKIVSENQIKDPADYISEQLVSELASKYQLNQINVNNGTLKNDDVQNISNLYKDADYVLDIRTVDWRTLPGHVGNRYRVIYSTKLRLIDTNERTVVAEGLCSKNPKNSDPDYSYDDLMGNNAEKLKSQLKERADYCVGLFKKEVFRIQ